MSLKAVLRNLYSMIPRDIIYPPSYGYHGDAVKLYLIWTPPKPVDEARVLQLLNLLQALFEALSGVIPLRFTVTYVSERVQVEIWMSSPTLMTVGFIDLVATASSLLPAFEAQGALSLDSSSVTIEPYPTASGFWDRAGVILGALGGALFIWSYFKKK